jgi:hypothetical protein
LHPEFLRAIMQSFIRVFNVQGGTSSLFGFDGMIDDL